MQDGTDWVGAGLLGSCQAALCFLWPLKSEEQTDFNIKPGDCHITFYFDVTKYQAENDMLKCFINNSSTQITYQLHKLC